MDMPSTLPHLPCHAVPEVQHEPCTESSLAMCPNSLHCIALELIPGQCWIAASHISKDKLEPHCTVSLHIDAWCSCSAGLTGFRVDQVMTAAWMLILLMKHSFI